MKNSFIKVVILVSALLPFGNASAVLLNFACISGNDPSGSACAIGEAQFTLDVQAIGDASTGGVSMLLANTEQMPPLLLNNGSNPNPSITELYFDTSLFTTQGNAALPGLPAGTFNTNQTTLNWTGIVSFIEGPQAGVDLLGVTPPDLPGGNAIGFQTSWAAEAFGEDNGQSTMWGVGEGESLEVRIATLSLNLFLAALEAGDFGIGIHVRAFEGDGLDFSESFVIGTPNPIPVPAAFWLFGTALIGFIGISRRTRL